MEKLMSFFQATEKRKPAKYEEEGEDRSETPPPDDRRKWSISRSGRMKQANKKRHNVTVDHYGETCVPVEKPTSVEYHVNQPVTKPTQGPAKPEPKNITPEPKDITPEPKDITPEPKDITPEPKGITPEPKDMTPEPRSPEEEIESAFEILDKVDKAS